MCDVLPTICEDGAVPHQIDDFSSEEGVDEMIEHMVEEKERLVETLKEVQEELSSVTADKMNLKFERDALLHQLNSNLPQDIVTLGKEVCSLQDLLKEKNEEIDELKAERNNTRLLLEHLECLVSRHERSLRMTVVKRQSNSPAGVSSEVEVLKALKSLFEHHKALDEKLRQKLRGTIERVSQLEDELNAANNELFQLRESESKIKVNSDSFKNIAVSCTDLQKLNNFSINSQSNRLSLQVPDIDNSVSADTTISDNRSQVSEMKLRLSMLEEQIDVLQRDLTKSQDQCAKLHADNKEYMAQRADQEERITTLEKRYLVAQRESSTAHDKCDKLQSQIDAKQNTIKIYEEKIQRLTTEVETLTSSKFENKLGEDKQENVQTKIKNLEAKIEELTSQLEQIRMQESLTEEHNVRLSKTVDRLLQESNERLQVHLKEKIKVLEEKNHLQHDLEQLRKELTHTKIDRDNYRDDLNHCHEDIAILREHVIKNRLSSTSMPMVVSDALSDLNNLIPSRQRWNNIDNKQRYMWDGDSHISSNRVLISDHSLSSFKTSQDNAVNPAPTIIQEDQQALARLLQDQLDVINNEIRMIQEEKSTTAKRAEELEIQIGPSGETFDPMMWPSPPITNGQLPSFPSPSIQRRTLTPKYRIGVSAGQAIYPYSSNESLHNLQNQVSPVIENTTLIRSSKNTLQSIYQPSTTPQNSFSKGLDGGGSGSASSSQSSSSSSQDSLKLQTITQQQQQQNAHSHHLQHLNKSVNLTLPSKKKKVPTATLR